MVQSSAYSSLVFVVLLSHSGWCQRPALLPPNPFLFIGATGSSGATGNRGQQGQIGVVGAKGIKGMKGEAGVAMRGAPGQTGIKGDPGESDSLQAVGATGNTGSSGATGLLGLTGFKGDFGMPGWTGGTGWTGPKGEPGDPGLPVPGGGLSFATNSLKSEDIKDVTEEAEVTQKDVLASAVVIIILSDILIAALGFTGLLCSKHLTKKKNLEGNVN